MKPDYVLHISNNKFTGGVIVETISEYGDEMIRETLPMLRKFRGSSPKELKDWVLKIWPETQFEILPSPTQGHEIEDGHEKEA